MGEKKSSVGFVSLSAFIHGGLLLGLVLVPALRILPNSSRSSVEIVTAESNLPSAPALEAVKTVAAVAQPEVQAKPVITAAPIKPKVVAKAKPAVISPAKKVIDTELPAKVKSIPPSENVESDAELEKVQAEAETFAKDPESAIIPAQETAPAEPDTDEVYSATAEQAASEAVTKQEKEEAEPLPPPTTRPAVQKLSEIQETKETPAPAAPVEQAATAPSESTVASTSQAGGGNDPGATGPSTAELRSYLDLKQLPGNRPPNYPVGARRQGQQGEVVLNYYVTSNGSVRQVRVVQSSGHPDLDQEATKAIARYRYMSGQEGWTTHPVVFSLKGPAAPQASRLRTAGETARD